MEKKSVEILGFSEKKIQSASFSMAGKWQFARLFLIAVLI